VEKSNQKGDQRMNSLSTILSSSTGTQASGGSSVMFIVVYIAIFAAIIYFMMIRPQKKQKAKTDQMLSQMEPGDNIMTTSGFYGNCRIPMHKSAVAELEKQGSSTVTDDDKDKKSKI